LKEYRCSQLLTTSLVSLRSKVPTITDTGDPTISYILLNLHKARIDHRNAKHNAREHRDDHLESLATQEAARHHQKAAHVLRRILATEHQKTIFQKLNHVLQRRQPRGLPFLKVPAEAYQPGSHRPIDGLESYPTTSDNWITLDNQDDIEAHPIARNNTHYRQANNTPFGNTPRGTHLAYLGTTDIADSILDGSYSFHLDELTEEAKAYLAALRHPDHNLSPADHRPCISTHISLDDLANGFSKWPEATSTSPSSRHLGHYRALLYDFNVDTADAAADDLEQCPLLRILHRMINIPILTGSLRNGGSTLPPSALRKRLTTLPQTKSE